MDGINPILERNFASGPAIEDFINALELAEKMNDGEQITTASIELGKAYYRNSQIQLGIECYEKALKIAIEQGNKNREIDARIGLVEFYKVENEIQPAIDHNTKLVEIFKRTDKDLKQLELSGKGIPGKSY